MDISQVRAVVEVARWLGPWASPEAAPGGIERRVGFARSPSGRDVEVHHYAPRGRAVDRAWFVVPGLHFLGPHDPRFERLCRVLAASGAAVLAPCLEDLMAQEVLPSVLEDAEAALVGWLDGGLREGGLREGDLRGGEPREGEPRQGELAGERAGGAGTSWRRLAPGVHPALFSISFGSLVALRLASLPALAGRLRLAVIFGGYADPWRSIRFAVTGEVDGGRRLPFDVLNLPAVMLNLLDTLPAPPEQPDAVRAALRRYMRQTWGHMELRDSGHWRVVARRNLAGLGAHDAALVRVGTGLEPGIDALADHAFRVCPSRMAVLDPGPFIEALHTPVVAIHGRADDVLPYTEAERLVRLAGRRVPATLLLTGLYAHTAAGGVEHAGWAARLEEYRTLWRMLRVLARGA